jgi:hypothetical protein
VASPVLNKPQKKRFPPTHRENNTSSARIGKGYLAHISPTIHEIQQSSQANRRADIFLHGGNNNSKNDQSEARQTNCRLELKSPDAAARRCSPSF